METDQYLEVFLDESREHLQAVNDNILKLEKKPDDLDIVNEIFRSAHTLKGMSATMGYEDIASLTHKMENVLDQIRNNKLTVTTEVIDIIFLAIEYLEDMVDSISAGKDGKRDVSELVYRLELVEKGETASDSDTRSEVASTIEPKETLQLELDEFQMTIIEQAKEQNVFGYQLTVSLSEDSILKGARAFMVFEALEKIGEVIKTSPAVEEIEEGDFDKEFTLIFLSKQTADAIKAPLYKISEVEHVAISTLIFELKEQVQEVAETTQESSVEVENTPAESKNNHASKTIRVNLERIDDLLNLFEEVVIDRSRLEVISEGIDNPDLLETVEHMGRVSSDMQSLILAMRMVQIEQVFNRFPRMIRGLARDLNKKINLEIIGAETELDRTVIDEIGDPLVHLIRNSVDHGIEMPEVRKQAGKPEEGKIILRAFHSGNHVFIEIEDDGAGINRNKVEAKAIEKGIITAEHAETLSDDEVAQLILSSGFSTADHISNISGRGVGLDVVKSKIESLSGRISIETEEGKGSIFSIQLPLTLSIISTLLVRVQQETYAIPLSSIIETVLLEESEIMTAHGQKVMDFRGHVIPLVALAEVFQVPTMEKEKSKHEAIVIVKKGDKLTGLIVDSFLGQKEVVLKSLGYYLGDVFAISGATILGDGEVALIIDPNALIK
ncbi:chemotaxis protein CheA [Oceanobacillus zhaokaii]|uniref:Chemotaxis protein CheA n=1 Tax=Oceanobacillus zhaokaii TaxID=2052660 RepID=A0A345PJ66_9BACI|nr:chemotaxis protein CheA [Oceanobacillus zhaokaii]AXI10046.1 chemotaxis protein CheA [Oceanobacillus zhaokaii]